MKTFFTSDLHLGHHNILKYDSRPFGSIEEHDEALLANHNSVVGDHDLVYNLGDVSFSAERVDWWLTRAKGVHHLIRGNHDDRAAWRSERWASKHEALFLVVGREQFYLSHYAHRTWRNSHHNCYHLYGHTHGALEDKPWGKSMDVGVMCHDYKPVAMEDVIIHLCDRPPHPYPC